MLFFENNRSIELDASSGPVCPFYQETAVMESCLHRAAFEGRVGDVEQIVSTGVDPNMRAGASRVTPLHVAVGRSGAIQALVAAGADVNAQDADGNTPLIRATCLVGFMAGNMEQLLKAGACPNIKNARGRTALHEAVRYFAFEPDEGRLRVLLKYGASLDVQDHDGCTPIDLASQEDNQALFIFLCVASYGRLLDTRPTRRVRSPVRVRA
jgi:ankyrin repeat protein